MLGLLLSTLLALGPEIPASPPDIGEAHGLMRTLRVASNGEVALAAWEDNRSGSRFIFASRVDRHGRVLDPLGLRLNLPLATLGGVVWNGTRFAVFASASNGEPVVSFISVDGRVAGERRIDLRDGFRFAAATPDGAAVRVLLLRQGFPAELAVVDGEGNIERTGALPPHNNCGFVAGGSETGFLVQQGSGLKELTTRISAAGEVLSSKESALGLPLCPEGNSIAGRPHGWLLLPRAARPPGQPIDLYRFAADGTFTSREPLLEPAPNAYDAAGRIVRDGDDFLVTVTRWAFPAPTRMYAIRVPAVGSPAPPRELCRWDQATMGDAAVAAAGSQRMVVAIMSGAWPGGGIHFQGMFAHVLTSALEPAAPWPARVTSSAAAETLDAVAVSGDRYLAVFHDARNWFARREDGKARVLYGRKGVDWIIHLASNERTYLLVRTADGYHVQMRRMDAATGEWLDHRELEVGTKIIDGYHKPSAAVASNGTDAVVIWRDERELWARRIRMTGDPRIDQPVLLWTSEESGMPRELAIASNGADYLAVWSDAARQVHALRLRSDGTKIDALPLLLAPAANAPIGRPAVAWNRGRYVAVWPAGDHVRGTGITAEGALVEKDTALSRAAGGPVQAKLVANQDAFVLFTRRPGGDAMLVWEAVAFDGLRGVAELPRTPIASGEGEPYARLDAASNGRTVFLAYDKLSGPDLGYVPRLFLRWFGAAVQPRRRAVR